jgi:hypothetical protein
LARRFDNQPLLARALNTMRRKTRDPYAAAMCLTQRRKSEMPTASFAETIGPGTFRARKDSPSVGSWQSVLRAVLERRSQKGEVQMLKLWGVHNDHPELDLVGNGFISISWEELSDLSKIGPSK